jgi:hypothetical protein
MLLQSYESGFAQKNSMPKYSPIGKNQKSVCSSISLALNENQQEHENDSFRRVSLSNAAKAMLLHITTNKGQQAKRLWR